MAPIPIIAPTIVRFSLQHTVTGGRPADVIVDLSLDEIGVPRHDAVATLVPMLTDEWQTTMVVQGSGALHYTGCQYIDLDSLGGIRGFQAPNASKPLNGLQGGATAPPNVSWLIHKQCNPVRGQRNGRMYFPTIPEANAGDDGVIVSTAYNNMQTAINNFRTNVNNFGTALTHEVAWRVVHVVSHDENGKPDAWNSTDITSVQVDSKVATQRRRLRK